jgi:hypothetical protein
MDTVPGEKVRRLLVLHYNKPKFLYTMLFLLILKIRGRRNRKVEKNFLEIFPIVLICR